MFLQGRVPRASAGAGDRSELAFTLEDLPAESENEKKRREREAASDAFGDPELADVAASMREAAFEIADKASPASAKPSEKIVTLSEPAFFDLGGPEEVSSPEERVDTDTVVASPFDPDALSIDAPDALSMNAPVAPTEDLTSLSFGAPQDELAAVFEKPAEDERLTGKFEGLAAFDAAPPAPTLTLPEPLSAPELGSPVSDFGIGFALELGSPGELPAPETDNVPREPEPQPEPAHDFFTIELGTAGEERSIERALAPSDANAFAPIGLDEDAPALGAPGDSYSPAPNDSPEAFASPGTSEKAQFVEDVLSFANGLSQGDGLSLGIVSREADSNAGLAKGERGGLNGELSHSTGTGGSLAGDWGVKIQTNVSDAVPLHEPFGLSESPAPVSLWNLGDLNGGAVPRAASHPAATPETPSIDLLPEAASSDGAFERNGHDEAPEGFGGANGFEMPEPESEAAPNLQEPERVVPVSGAEPGAEGDPLEVTGGQATSSERARGFGEFAGFRPDASRAAKIAPPGKSALRKNIAAGLAAVCGMAIVFVYALSDETLSEHLGLSDLRRSTGLFSTLPPPPPPPPPPSADVALRAQPSVPPPRTQPNPISAPKKAASAKGKAVTLPIDESLPQIAAAIAPESTARRGPAVSTKPILRPAAQPKNDTVAATSPSGFEDVPPSDYTAIGKNSVFFQGIEEAIVRGDFLLAKKRFEQAPPQKVEQPLELSSARALLVRFYLGVSNVPRAAPLLAADCKIPDDDKALRCIHHARALVSAGRFQDARRLLALFDERADGAGEWKRLGLLTSLVSASATALAQPTIARARPLLDHFLTQMNLNPEWCAQRSTWIVRALARLRREDRQTLAVEILRSRRADWEAALTVAEGANNRASDVILLPYLNNLAAEFELPPFAMPQRRSRFESDVAAAGLLLEGVRLAFVEPSQNVLASLVSLRGREGGIADALRLLQMNLALQDNELGTVQQQLEIVKRASPEALLFRYDWALVGARFATQTQSTEVWVEAFRNLLDAARAEPLAVLDFQYWLQQARLLRLMRKDPNTALRRAQGLALTPREKGLLEVEYAYTERSLGKVKEAFARLQRACATYPHHGVILQAAAEMAGQAGADPTVYIKRQAAIPDEFLRRSQDAPALSDVTLLKILENL